MSKRCLALFLIVIFVGVTVGDDSFSEKGCNNPADIVFVLDESGSIWGPHFTEQLNFVQDIIDSFDVRHNKTHFGVMTFATDPRIIFQLGEFHTHESLKNNIKVIEQRRGETFTDKALQLVRHEMFSPKYSRPWVPHVVIFITDGESNYPEDTAKEALLAQQKGLQIFAVGVGPYVNKDELLTIAGSADQVFQVDSYAVLQSLRELLAWKTCQVTTLPPPTTTPPPPQMIEACSGSQKMDTIWAVSDTATSLENSQVLEFIADVTTSMKLSPLRVQVGLTPKFCQNADAIQLKDHDTHSGFTQALSARRFDVEASTHQHLKYIREKGMTGDSGARSDSIKYGVIVVDAAHGDNFGKTKREAKKAIEAGIKLIVIGVGKNVDQSELDKIASSPDDVISVDSYSSLTEAKSAVTARLCKGITDGQRRRFYFKRFYPSYNN